MARAKRSVSHVSIATHRAIINCAPVQMSSAFSTPTVLRSSQTPIIICSSLLSNPHITPRTMVNRSAKILQDYRVGTIINTSLEVQTTPRQFALYRELGIQHIDIPIDDTISKPPPEDFLPRVIQAYESHDKNRSILINCTMGVNRSAFAAGAIMWSTTATRPWETPEQMIEDMRASQKHQRGIHLLTNNVFEGDLIHWCKGDTNLLPVDPRFEPK